LLIAVHCSAKMKGADDDGFETAESTDDGGGADRPAKKKRTKTRRLALAALLRLGSLRAQNF
jgi:hypothetical protein